MSSRAESSETSTRATSGTRCSAAASLLAFFALAALAHVGCAPERAQRDVLLVTIDTLRPDFLEPYGFAQPSSPRIAELAAEGVLFENAIAAGSLTAPAHASIMTGRYVRQHSVGSLNGETRLADTPTLAEQFERAGYSTAAFISNVVLRRRVGLDRGFGIYDDDLPEGELNRPAYFERTADATAERALAWLGDRRDGPVFMWLHLQDPHGPYTPPDETRGRIEDVPLRVKQALEVLDSNTGRAGIPAYQALPGHTHPGEYAARYAEEVLFADRFVGEVVDAMRARREGEPPIVLLTADHGESMGELGWFFQHGQSATPDLARVPFVLVAPGAAPRRERAWVSHVDVAPTLLELAGLGELEGATGTSLAGLVEQGRPLDDRVVFCDTEGETAAYFEGGIVRAIDGATFSRPAAASGPVRFEGLREKAPGVWRPMPVDARVQAVLVDYLTEAVPVVAAEAMQPEHVEQLRALGYIEPEEHVEPEAALEDSEAGDPQPEEE